MIRKALDLHALNCEYHSHIGNEEDVMGKAAHDIVIRNGVIVDGTGRERFEGDVAIRDGLVTPGFVDMHTHYDGQVTWDEQLTPSSWHGCTTVVMGNCGVGFAPVRKEDRDWVIRLMEGVEDIPGAALHEGMRWDWETFPGYLDALSGLDRAIDFGTQVPHGPLRTYVMGERGVGNEAATAKDCDAMGRLVEEAIRAGALGVSTSRTMLHKSSDGDLVPGTFAERDELFALAHGLRRGGHGVFQMAGEHLQMGKELEWIAELALETGRPVMFNLTQTDFAPELWRDLLGGLEAMAARGAQVYGQVAGRAIGLLMGWELTAHPFARHPAFLELADRPKAERLAALATPEVRARLLNETVSGLPPFEQFVTRSFHKMFPVTENVDYEPAKAESLREIARATGRRPEELAYEALMADDGDGLMYFPLFNYAGGDLEHLKTLHNHPLTRMGLSDGGAHCATVCDAGMPTFMLTHWTRDRARGDRLGLEHVIRRQTSETAQSFGMMDRGILAPGYRADVNVIDYDGLTLERPELVRDLPAGGPRLLQRARGYTATLVAGQVTRRHDTSTGALPGRLVRGPQTAPSFASVRGE
jgi:N-acyl-D-amino-acid deacylase